MRVTVIGAGIVGMSAASYLQRDGHEVFVVDPNEPGEGASFGNAGCINPSSVVPMSMPGTIRNVPKWLRDPLGPLSIRWSYLPFLTPWLIRFIRAGQRERVEAQAKGLKALLGPALINLAPLVKAAGAEDLLHRVGHLVVYKSAETRAKDAAAWNLRRENGVQFEELNADELRQLEPELSREYTQGVLVGANGHVSNPGGLVKKLAEAFVRNGGRLVREAATGFEFIEGKLTAVRTRMGTHQADRAVLAAGIWSRPLAVSLGDRLPLETERGYHVMVRDPEVMPRIPTMSGDGKFVATPMETGLRFAGTVEFAGLNAGPDWRRADILLRQGQDMYPKLARSYPEARLTRWMGHRPSFPDSLPVIDRSARSPDVFYAFGHGHTGMTGGSTTGKIVADLVAGRAPGIDLAPFSRSRFA
ncbi:MAG TPA: FAD-dependent oxidoreductase [Alphaproteobacteria bacterium]|nr:FAD-dependent oxidoreductase [Alphaproteobacteria bacterium]